ncbi:MAG: transcriptional repressor [Johnsonella sp.]|nr:transcriptional repressor [Johnsonella sp.]
MGEDIVQKVYRTKTKDAIMSYIESNKHRRFSAADIYKHIKTEQKKEISLTTIYRNLEKLTGEGVLLKIKTAEGEYSVYQFLNADGSCDEHLHIQCKVCGQMIHINDDAMDKANMYLLQHCGFSLICKDSVLIGYCDHCKNHAKPLKNEKNKMEEEK